MQNPLFLFVHFNKDIQKMVPSLTLWLHVSIWLPVYVLYFISETIFVGKTLELMTPPQ